MAKKLGLLFLAVFFLTGCGATVVETVQPVIRQSPAGNMKTVVVLPFSDYTNSDSLYDYWKRNILVNESICDELTRYGFRTSQYEETIGYLLDRGIIKDTVKSSSAELEKELQKDWSPQMRSELLREININNALNNQKRGYWDTEKLIRLDSRSVRNMGAHFDADYILRGRILVMNSGLEDSMNPFQTGIAPFVFKLGSRTVFGFAESDQYELIDKMAVGGVIGAAIADKGWPIEDDKKTSLEGDPRFGGGLAVDVDSYEGWNRAIWGAAGAGLAYLADKGGRVDRSWVQLRMVAQDARTGQIVWTNRAEVKVTPKSFFGDRDMDSLTSQAIQHATGRLIDNFVASLTGCEVVRSRVDGTIYVTPAGGIYASDKTSYGTIHVGPPMEESL